jgi:hypothetical protein
LQNGSLQTGKRSTEKAVAIFDGLGWGGETKSLRLFIQKLLGVEEHSRNFHQAECGLMDAHRGAQ